jgi:hypothetical protein
MVTSKNLNQAAMLVAIGAKVIDIRDGYPAWEFVLQVNPWLIWYEKHVGIIPYRRYVGSRVLLKEMFYRKYGKNTEFRGKKDGFVFNDVVRVIPFTKRERRHLGL